MYQVIQTDTWKRGETFRFFSTFEDPIFGMVANVDITRLYAYCNEYDVSFFLSLLYISQQTVNAIPEFRMRLKDNEVVIYDVIHCGSTVLHNDETFSFCYFENKDSLHEFVAAGEKNLADQLSGRSFDPRNDALNMIHYSMIPWVSFTGLKHARRHDPKDTIPKITFGKYFWEGDTLKIPVSVEVHHGMMDGLHVARYFRELEEKGAVPGMIP